MLALKLPPSQTSSGWDGKAGGFVHGLRGGVAVVVLEGVVLDFASDPLELGVQDEVDDARDRVGAVHGGSTAGEDVHPLHERGGDEVQVGRGFPCVTGRHPATVDQDQRADRAQLTQVHRRRTRRTVGDRSSSARRRACGRAWIRSSIRAVPW